MKRILIADDEPNILLSLDFLMRKNGYEVFIARDGKEAVDIIKNTKTTHRNFGYYDARNGWL